MGADYLATGHYAIIRHDADGAAHLHRAVDETKDQSSVLYTFTQQQLARTLLPLGTLTKREVRAIARAHDLPVAEKPESQDICFVPDGDYARIVAERQPDAFTPGEIVDTGGTVVGRHAGIGHYTVGQRRGLRIAQGERRYVVGMERDTNRVVIGSVDDLTAHALVADDVLFIGETPTEPIVVEAMVRYRSTPVPAIFTPLPERTARLVFPAGLRQPAATPGQSVVLYRGDEVLGGGTIERVERGDGTLLDMDALAGMQTASPIAVIAMRDLAVIGEGP
jgi:tRNA-specific 2-thiouridylase